MKTAAVASGPARMLGCLAWTAIGPASSFPLCWVSPLIRSMKCKSGRLLRITRVVYGSAPHLVLCDVRLKEGCDTTQCGRYHQAETWSAPCCSTEKAVYGWAM